MGRNRQHAWKSEYARQWYIKNRDKWLAYCKARRHGPRGEKMRARDRELGKINAKRKQKERHESYKRHPETMKKYRSRYGGIFFSWANMIQRCTNPKHVSWHNYGGRGIKVCKRWRKLENFIRDMGPRPAGKSIDRWPNPNGNYTPKNCRWATRHEQALNRRKRRSKCRDRK